jgi:hypothetical protein
LPRSPEITSRTVRLVISSFRAALMICDMRLCRALVAAEADVVQARLDDAPLDEGVDQDVLLLGRDEAVGIRRVQRQDALVEVDHVLERRRQLEVQARLGDDFTHFAEGEDDREAALVDHEHGRRQQHQGNEARHENGYEAVH